MTTRLQEKIDDLGHHLKVKFGLPPDRPTTLEVLKIIREIETIPEAQRTDAAWRRIVHQHVIFEGHVRYEGLDLSDINDLQSQIMLLLG